MTIICISIFASKLHVTTMIINIFATDIFVSKPGWLGWVAGFAGRLGLAGLGWLD